MPKITNRNTWSEAENQVLWNTLKSAKHGTTGKLLKKVASNLGRTFEACRSRYYILKDEQTKVNNHLSIVNNTAPKTILSQDNITLRFQIKCLTIKDNFLTIEI